ncbi:MAG TPA: cupin domain-containing protein [Trinickia sp.]|jgi:quercetin dioxygenase-like cupin family protein|nr:cupin domain-containing protein [Trinickia sp.]
MNKGYAIRKTNAITGDFKLFPLLTRSAHAANENEKFPGGAQRRALLCCMIAFITPSRSALSMPSLFEKGLLALAAGIIAVSATATEPTNPESAVSSVLLKADHSWDGTPYTRYPAGRPQLTVLKIVIPAHTSLPWHRHPMPNAAYVVSGTLTVESRDGQHQTTLHAGDVLPEMVDADHRGTTGDTPVELIVFYAGAADMPTAIKAK